MAELPPENLVHAALAELDPKIQISMDIKRVAVSLEAVCKLLADPSPMIERPAI